MGDDGGGYSCQTETLSMVAGGGGREGDSGQTELLSLVAGVGGRLKVKQYARLSKKVFIFSFSFIIILFYFIFSFIF